MIWGPGRKLGDLGELSQSYSSPSFRVGPICITRKLGDVWKPLRNFPKLSLSHCLSLYSLTAWKRISFVVQVRPVSPSYSSPSFHVGPMCITRKLGVVWKSFQNFAKLSLSHCLSLYSLTACKRISFVV